MKKKRTGQKIGTGRGCCIELQPGRWSRPRRQKISDKGSMEELGLSEKGVNGGEFIVANTVDVGLLNPHHWPVMDWNVIDLLSYISDFQDCYDSLLVFPDLA